MNPRQELIEALRLCRNRLAARQSTGNFHAEDVEALRAADRFLSPPEEVRTMKLDPEPTVYTVVAVSSNTNSFGYKSVLCLAPNGRGLQLLKSAYGGDPLPEVGKDLREGAGWHSQGFVQPHVLPPTSIKKASALIAKAKQCGKGN